MNMESRGKLIRPQQEPDGFRVFQKKVKKWPRRIINIVAFILSATFWYCYMYSLVNFDVEGQRVFYWALIYNLLVDMSLTYFLDIFTVDSSGWIENYLFLVFGFILEEMASAIIDVNRSKWTTIPIVQLVATCITLMCILLTLSVRYVHSLNVCIECVTKFLGCIQWMSFAFTILLNIFHISLAYYIPHDETGYLEFLQALLCIIVLGLVAECGKNVLKKEKSKIMSLVFTISGVVFLLVDIINKILVKRWNNETIILFCVLMTLILFMALFILQLYVKKLVKNEHTLTDFEKNEPEPEFDDKDYSIGT